MTMQHAMIPNEREFEFSDKDFRFLASLAHQKTGIQLQDNKRDMVYARLVRRLRALGLSSFAEYCEFLRDKSGEDEIGQLVNAITTNLTGFFREVHHFEHLKNEVLQPLIKNSGQRKLRMWSAACSSGMEPYSMAMTLKEAIPDVANWDAKILATDIDSNMLNVGKEGEYSQDVLQKTPSVYHRFFSNASKPGTVRVEESVKKLIAFRQLNLLESWPMKGQFDVVFCRNVVIYFDKPTKEVLFERIANILKPDGWLYIGHSENLHNISNRFKLLGRTIYQRVV